MRSALALAASLVALPAFAQSRVITDRDLGKPLPRIESPARALEIAKTHEYHAPPRHTSTVSFSARSSVEHGPFGELKLTPTAPLSAPFIAPYWVTWPWTYSNGGYFGRDRAADTHPRSR